ncbi:inner-membrane translocator [Raoultella ornithinolytica]|nr:inner-membrane translocator [Raoultella ornithinolytica]
MTPEETINIAPAPSPLHRLLCWEGFLLAVTLVVFVVCALASPYFLNIWNLSDATFNFTEKAIVVLPMAMLIIAREIDLSVASTMALSSTVMGFCAAAGWIRRCWWPSGWEWVCCVVCLTACWSRV